MKYRCKVTSPWTVKGAVFTKDAAGFVSIRTDSDKLSCLFPEDYPDLFEPIEEEKPRTWARTAMYNEKDKVWTVLLDLYDSKDLAEANLLGDEITKVLWPARFDIDGFLIIPGDE